MINDPETTDLTPLKNLLTPEKWTEDEDKIAPKLKEWRDRWHGQTPLLLLPKTCEDVAIIVTYCQAHKIALTIQGGNTGLVGGQIPQGEVLLSLEKMDQIRTHFTADAALVVEAGVTLAKVQETALTCGSLFPLSLASENAATLGGLVSTNAGGIGVLRYGMMRDLVLGLEAVLPDGSIYHGLSRLRKDNSGYDIKQLLIGAEGTLGVVTALALKLFPQPRSRALGFVSFKDIATGLALFHQVREETSGLIEAFEVINHLGMELVLKHMPDHYPLSRHYPWYGLIEIASGEPDRAEHILMTCLEQALSHGLITEAVIAKNEKEREQFWSLRESQSAAQKREGPAWKHDISLPLSALSDFVLQSEPLLQTFCPGVRSCIFGHMGDGNLHFDVLAAEGANPQSHLDKRDEAAKIIYDLVYRLEGSISAEHGLGIAKIQEAQLYKNPVAITTMRTLRKALDPNRILNPRVLF